jgi:hypothetical protein
VKGGWEVVFKNKLWGISELLEKKHNLSIA